MCWTSTPAPTIRRARWSAWRNDAVAGQARDQGLVPPPPERGAPLETPSIGAGHIRICAGFVEKNQALGVDPHDFLPPGPVISKAKGALQWERVAMSMVRGSLKI